MPTPSELGHVGARIREQRRLAHLTQRQLAQRLPYSYSLLNQVECGAREASSGFVAAVAAALHIDISLLTEPETVTTAQRQRLAAMVQPIRHALDLYDLSPAPVQDRPPLARLIASADTACRQVRATRLRAAAGILPDLITGLTHEVQTRPSTDAWRALASVYRTAHDVALKVRYSDLAGVALDRMGWAAERASDPCLAAVRHYKRALVRQETHELGIRLIEAGHFLLADERSREALVVTGQLHLGAVAVAARAGDREAVAGHLAAAQGLADRVGGEAGGRPLAVLRAHEHCHPRPRCPYPDAAVGRRPGTGSGDSAPAGHSDLPPRSVSGGPSGRGDGDRACSRIPPASRRGSARSAGTDPVSARDP